MYFKLIYNPDPDAGYHARLYGENPKRILFWTKDYKVKQDAINACGDVRREMRADTPIYDVD
jgi:uncharacterized protein YegP (UPF0339 family)